MRKKHKNAASNLLIQFSESGQEDSSDAEKHCDFCATPDNNSGMYPTHLEAIDDWLDEERPVDGVTAVITNGHVVEWL